MSTKREKEKRKSRQALRMIALISQLGICMLTCIFICVFIGSRLSSRFGIDILFPLFLLLGIMAGFRSCYHMIKRFGSLK